MLFRNFIEVLKKSDKYKDYQITLLGNNTWQSLAYELDNNYIDNYIFVDRNQFNNDFVYRCKKLKEITSKAYEVVLSPVYSRELFVDNIVKFIKANEKIGSISNFSNITPEQKAISDTYYTNLIPTNDEIMFEFYRNKDFFENLLDTKLDVAKPSISLKQKKTTFDLLPENYAILFIGASTDFRKWNIKNFVKVAEHLKTKYSYQIVLCGTSSDKENAKKFSKYFPEDYIDLVDKTSLIDLLYVISNGNIMIANETSAPHFAIALEMTNVFVIYNGNHYGRFTPYPKEMSNEYHVIYHPEIDKNLNNYKKLSNSYGYCSQLDINEISIENVIGKIDRVLNR